MAASKYTANMFDAEELAALREKFNYVDTDIKGRHRLFMDNAGGSLRLKAAENEFKRVSEMPDASEHSNELALELLALEDKARIDIKSVIFGAKTGVIYPSYTASQIMMDVARPCQGYQLCHHCAGAPLLLRRYDLQRQQTRL